MIRKRCPREFGRSHPVGAGPIARVGAPPLIALACALALLGLLLCAFFVPGFVLRAEADSIDPPAQTAPTQPMPTQTVPTQSAPPDPGAVEPAPGDPSLAEPAPVEPAGDEPAPVDPAPIEQPPGRALATLPWGHGIGQVGLARAQEGLTRGPEALAVAPDGRIAILDTVNLRLVLLAADGSLARNIPVDLSEPRFLAVDDSTIYVLDADADHELLSLNWQGSELRDARMPAFDDVVTGLFATDRGPCLEVAHNDVFLIDFKDDGKKAAVRRGPGGRPALAALRVLAGRPVDRDLSKVVKASFKADHGVRLKRAKIDKTNLKELQSQEIAPAFPGGVAVEHLVSMDGDGRGGLLIGARLLSGQGQTKKAPPLVIGRVAGDLDNPLTVPAMTDVLTLLDSSFAYLGQPYVVAPDGRVFQPVGSEAGYAIMIYTVPSVTFAAPPVEVQP